MPLAAGDAAGERMRRAREAVAGAWEFVAGDDWVTAVGVVAALALTALLDEAASAWIVTPVAVALLLALSIWRQARSSRTPPGPSARRTTMDRP
jgi:hypothetical protein